MATDLTIKMGKLPLIEANFDEVKAELAELLRPYDSIISDVPSAKADRAKLNRIAKALDERKKAVKAEYLEPYSAFESRVKELQGMITDASAKIDAQIKAIEGDEKEAKRKRLEAFFDASNDTITLEFADIFNERWLNKTFDELKAQDEILEAIAQAKEDERVVILGLKILISKSQIANLKGFLEAQHIMYEV
ncbi:MAG: DUF1351 domain-containing protein, partial [Clostridia bacterium]|nr:DUF1351 domain-containing protein [Clostridia bacterium]